MSPDREEATSWEPVLGESPASAQDPVPERIAALMARQRFGVLATQGGQGPYGSLLAVASSPDLRRLVFATPVTTRKYALLKACQRVALLLDSRADSDDMLAIEAVTILGEATELTRDDPRRGEARSLFLGEHPQLEGFLRAPSCALFVVEVERYVYVVRFQDVREWRPT